MVSFNVRRLRERSFTSRGLICTCHLNIVSATLRCVEILKFEIGLKWSRDHLTNSPPMDWGHLKTIFDLLSNGSVNAIV